MALFAVNKFFWRSICRQGSSYRSSGSPAASESFGRKKEGLILSPAAVAKISQTTPHIHNFYTIDLFIGYHKVPASLSDIPKTTKVTPLSFFEYLVKDSKCLKIIICFGLKICEYFM
jgi:hypothetical protein